MLPLTFDKKTIASDSVYVFVGENTKVPDFSLMMKTCEVLYDDDKWYKGTITSCISDGDLTYAARDDPEVNFP